MRSIAAAFSASGKAPPPLGPKRGAVALLCYGLLVVAWIVDLVTPQLFIAAILLNGPIALSSLALQSRLTTNLVIAAEIANVVAGYVNGVQAGHHWDGIAIGDRFLLAASFVLVGYLSIKTQEYAREAGVSAGRMRQVEIEKALARSDRSRTRNAQRRARAARDYARIGRTCSARRRRRSIARETPFGPPLVLYVFRAATPISRSSAVHSRPRSHRLSRAPAKRTTFSRYRTTTCSGGSRSKRWVRAKRS